jgi:hypothetical protein
MSDRFRKGQSIMWRWGTGKGHGKIVEAFERRVQRTIEGARISRNGSHENPAYLIETTDGKRVLKRGSELQPA